MSVSPPRRARSGIVAGAFLALFAFTGVVQALTDVDYPDVTNTRRSYVDFNIEVVRGFVYRTSPSFECFSVNAYESTIVRHTSLSGAPVSRWPTLTNPVSIAFDGTDLLVVGQGNHALARHDSATGEMKDVIMLGSEPADIVVDDETEKAYVSCMGDDSVWEIDISGTNFAYGQIWAAAANGTMPSTPIALALKRPRFLNLDKQGSGTSDNVVYVAPLISGNNTITTRQSALLPVGVHDGNDAAVFATNTAIGGRGLPDADLFRLTPSSGAAAPVLRQVGSIVTAHGKNPSTSAYWMLNVEEHNVDPAMLSEPALRGQFATNSLAIASSLPSSGAPSTPGTRIDLDDTTTGGTITYQADKSVSFPYALDFKSDGQAVIGSATTPVVVVVDSAGSRLRTLQLADPSSIQGRVVRTVKYHGSNVLAYCQQTSNIVVFSLSPLSLVPVSEMSLGNDPTPPAVAAGRGIWYDATRSLDGRTSCNTCHPQGGADGLVWQIGNVPVDDKGPLVTQTLLGIEGSFPYHWRGERSLADFNGAFPGLLGASAPLDEGELRQFEEFIFSLRPPANPLQDRDRLIKDGLNDGDQGTGLVSTPVPGVPTDGLDLYLNEEVDSAGSCVVCHTFPTGSNGEFNLDHADKIAVRSNFEVAHLDNQLALKRQPVVAVDLVSTSTQLKSNLLGSGNGANGDRANLFDFIDSFFTGLSQQQVSDVTAFVDLFDTGTAPSIHWAVRFNQANASTNTTPIRNQLLAQSADGWVGVVARGKYPVGATPTIENVNWYYDPTILRMVPDRTTFASGTLGNQTWTQFVAATNAGTADNVFFGVPPGNEFRIGADMDHDGLDYGSELALGTPTDPWNPDSDGDGYDDGYEVANGSTPTNSGSTPTDTTAPTLVGSTVEIDFVNAKSAKLYFRSSEPCKWTFTMTSGSYSSVVDGRSTYDTVHSAVVQALHPSPNQNLFPSSLLTYTWTLVLTDRAGLTATINNSGGSTQPNVTAGEIVTGGQRVVGALSLQNETRSGGTYSADVDIRLDEYEGLLSPNPRAGWVPILQVLKQVSGTEDWELVPSSDFTITSSSTYDDFHMDVNGLTDVSYSTNVLPGPYLVLPPSDSGGLSTGGFTVTGLSTGQPILVNVVGMLADENLTSGGVPYFTIGTIGRFLFPATPTELRNVESSL